MKTKHTPGPWATSENRNIGYIYYNDDTTLLAQVQGGRDEDDIYPNAKLMAAAPELLEGHIKNVELLEDSDFNNYIRLGKNTQKKLDACIKIMNHILVTSKESIQKATS